MKETSGCYVVDIGSRYLRCGCAGETEPRLEVLTTRAAPIAATVGTRAVDASFASTFSAGRKTAAIYSPEPLVDDGRVTNGRSLQRLLGECLTSIHHIGASSAAYHVSRWRSEKKFLNAQSIGDQLLDIKEHGLGVRDAPTHQRCLISMSCFHPGMLPVYSGCGSTSLLKSGGNGVEQVVEWLLYTRNVQQCQFVSPAVMSLYGTGRTSGLVVDMGYRSSRVCPVVEGQSLSASSVTRLRRGGQHITDDLEHTLRKRYPLAYLAASFELGEWLKLEACFVSQDIARDTRLSRETTLLQKAWRLPCGASISLNSERFLIPETLFSPHFDPRCFVEDGQTLCDTVGESLKNVPLDLRRPLLQAMVLVGGGSLLSGLPHRFDKELRRWYATHVMGRTKEDAILSGMAKLRTSILVQPDRDWLPFKGTSLFAELTANSTDVGITREMFEEMGMRALWSNCTSACLSGSSFH